MLFTWSQNSTPTSATAGSGRRAGLKIRSSGLVWRPPPLSPGSRSRRCLLTRPARKSCWTSSQLGLRAASRSCRLPPMEQRSSRKPTLIRLFMLLGGREPNRGDKHPLWALWALASLSAWHGCWPSAVSASCEVWPSYSPVMGPQQPGR